MNFNSDWEPDEADVWSDPAPSSTLASASAAASLHIQTSLDTHPGPPSPSSDHSATPTNTFNPPLPDPFATLIEPEPEPEPATLTIYTDALSSPLPTHPNLPSPNITFSPPSDNSSLQSVFSARSLDPTPNSPLAKDEEEDDEFGDFDDPMAGPEDEDEFQDFGGFTSAQISPLASPSRLLHPIIPFKLPPDLNLDSLRTALAPALGSLFDSAEKSVWLPDNQIPPSAPSPSSSNKPGPPAILNHSDQLQQAWNSLMENRNGLGAALDWKRSQIRRHHLVNLGIPVDLNDFLTPAPLPKQRLTLETRSLTSQEHLHPNTSFPSSHLDSTLPCPPTSSPTYTAAPRNATQSAPTPSIDRQRCKELLSLREEDLKMINVEKLKSIRDELTGMNATVSDLLAHTLHKRDKLNQDNESYNTMISDLISAAQRIKMGSPNVVKRTSSIQLGSSSITSAGSGRWRTAISGGSKVGTPATSHAPSPSVSAASATPKRFSVL